MSPTGTQVKAGKTLRVAVVADTHGRLPDALASQLAAADEIWHLGDFCDSATLQSLLRIGPPVTAVAGNNDYNLDLPQRVRTERHGRSFLLVHILPRSLPPVDAVLHGHTHVPSDVCHGRTRVLNPGTIGKPNKGFPCSWAWLEIPPAPGELEWRVVPLTP